MLVVLSLYKEEWEKYNIPHSNCLLCKREGKLYQTAVGKTDSNKIYCPFGFWIEEDLAKLIYCNAKV